jgi:hypothetical protein
MDMAQFNLIRRDVGQEPWKSALASLQSSGVSSKTANRTTSYLFSSLSYVPMPFATVASSTSNVDYITANHLLNQGGVELVDDARAAYAQALLWVATGNSANADKSIQIMNAWSGTLQQILFDQPRRTDTGAQVYDQGKLDAAWAGKLFARAAEIVRYTYTGWQSTDIARFSNMLKTVFLPLVISSWSSGANWLMSFADTTMAIGVFTDDRTTFNTGISMWKQYLPTMLYLTSDGPYPPPPSPGSAFDTPTEITNYWWQPAAFVQGLEGETLRDLSHMMFGLGSMMSAAKMAEIQGIDLIGQNQDRIIKGFEYNAHLLNGYLDEVASLGGATPPSTFRPPDWPGARFQVGGTGYKNGWELAYAEFAQRRGIAMPETSKVVKRLRPTGAQMQDSWDTLASAVGP